MTWMRWLAFAWASLACGVMGYYAAWWFIEPPDPAYNELLFGVGFGFLIGSPAFVLLPFLAFFGRPAVAAGRRVLLLAPLAGAAVTWGVVAALGSA